LILELGLEPQRHACGDYDFMYTSKYYILRRSPRRIQVALGQKSLFGKMRYLLLQGI